VVKREEGGDRVRVRVRVSIRVRGETRIHRNPFPANQFFLGRKRRNMWLIP
jgi:hypothetical protein